MAQRGQELVDGEGAARVLMYLNGERLRLRQVREDDCRLLWEWANDKEVRASAFSSDPIPWEEHVRWFIRKLHEPTCFIFIAVDNEDTPLGQVRFDVDKDGEAEIDVSIDRDKRGLGYGALLISKAVKEVIRVTHIRAVHAFIKPNNEASMRAFERAGFKRLGVENVRGNIALHYIWRRSDEQ
jgi:RimJ/RimL family protein N-acetyltransferase